MDNSFEKTGRQASQVKALFGFARELGRVRRENVTELRRHPWHVFFSEIDGTLPGVRKWTPDSRTPNVLLVIEQQDLPPCPNPGDELSSVIGRGWENPDWEPPEALARLPERLAKPFAAWIAKRKAWLLSWDRVSRSLDLFQEFYEKGRAIEESNLKLIAKAGTVSFASGPGERPARHPVLTRPIRIRLLVEGGRAVVRVEVDLAEPARFESELLSGYIDEGFRLEQCQQVREDVESTMVHPFDAGPVRASFQRLAAAISPDCRWFGSFGDIAFNERCRFAFYEEPAIWMEERPSGMAEASERIIREIDAGSPVPHHLVDLICGVDAKEGEAAARAPETLEERLAAAGGEDRRILLAKPSNREQLEVAREIVDRDAALVMGPPGTGKTHTIANLIGDFLAEGKTVLISSQKEKALRVLKDMLPKEMQDLCVSFASDRDDVFATVQALTDQLSVVRPEELRRRIESEARNRDEVFGELESVRRKIFEMILRESRPVAIGGREWTPAEAGRWLRENEGVARSFPAGVVPKGPFPLTPEELSELCDASKRVTPRDKREAESGLLALDCLPKPEEEAHLAAEESELRNYEACSKLRVESLGGQGGRKILRYSAGDLSIEAPYIAGGPVASLSEWLEKDRSVGVPDPWLVAARAAGAAGGAIKSRWEKLVSAVSEAASLAEKEIGQMDDFAVTVQPGIDREALREALQYFRENHISGEPGFLTKLTQKARLATLSGALVNGQVPSNDHEYAAVLLRLALEDARAAASKLWDDLVQKAGGPAFMSVGNDHPEEQVRLRYLPRLEKALSWWDGWAMPLLEKAEAAGINPALLTGGTGAGPVESCEALARSVDELLRPAATLDRVMERLSELEVEFVRIREALKPAEQAGSVLAGELARTAETDPEGYRKAWDRKETIRGMLPEVERAGELFARLSSAAPEWAGAIASGLSALSPEKVVDAWNWKLLDADFRKYLAEDHDDLERRAEELSEELRRKTVKLASDKAWLALALRLQGNRALMQKLQGWAQIASRIGRGSGKGVEQLRSEARDLMAACAEAVPCWIMPAERALSNFDGSWKFDIVVIDEASQSDIVSMPLLFLGRKAVIAGDDRQVSPAAVGVGDAAVAALSREYIQGRIANWPIYQAQASLYDLARTAYDPQMLREHFRCVPPIIGYSNRLSYNGRILPLRDSSSTNLFPPIVRCRVDGVREGNDSNRAEAEAIVGRIKACLAEPAYDGKTFGVIVMRSGRTGAQIQLINDLLYKAIGPQEIERRRILCGLSPDFQGDERDVIFLSLVDSAEPGKPLRRETAGSDDGMKKRWNVAVSRARDQVWAVYSFDPEKQLQDGDIRKTFFDYMKDAEKDAEQPESDAAPEGFVPDVARALASRGFRVRSGYRIGAFELPLVVEASGRKAVVECDGSVRNEDPEAVISAMERQVILERAGWKFVRVRGGEWSRDPGIALGLLLSRLASCGVKAEGKEAGTPRPAPRTEPDPLALVEAVQKKAGTFAAGLRQDSAAAAARRAKRARIIAELRKLGAEVDREVRKASRGK